MKLELKEAVGLVKLYQINTPTTSAPNYLGIHTYYRTEREKFRVNETQLSKLDITLSYSQPLPDLAWI